eukprot:Gregarina_sp_Pseudo_9__2251@NODE_2585_length_944_cov_277_029834_g2369_i0_p2_GENE_NODE_2585_length_944_cov_277_029834_g2369_i0NODE_2585_length_944_cov_277_029834_g2369_i0_p2_ORF_typecomplete_len112_score12_87ADH_N/PF08240_12/1_9e15_NODE_2585_length_944_cov_277_029834_g2369_i057392
MPIPTRGYAAAQAKADFEPVQYELRDLRDTDVLVDVHYCGVCAGDLAFRDIPVFGTQYPFVGGHEIAGIATQVGSKVSGVKPGTESELAALSIAVTSATSARLASNSIARN